LRRRWPDAATPPRRVVRLRAINPAVNPPLRRSRASARAMRPQSSALSWS
jgi:hypothetical protein